MDKNTTQQKSRVKLSPGRKQYLELKRQHPDALLLVRIGDFYETFDEDAHVMARELDIALTARDVGGGVKSALAGIPYHALNSYMGRLMKAGLKVAIAEQTSLPSARQKVVDREIVRLLTPGTITDPHLLEPGSSNYLVAVVVEQGTAGLACIDLTTSEFMTSEIALSQIMDELERLKPAEVFVNTSAAALLTETHFLQRDINPALIDLERAQYKLKEHFQVVDLEPFGCHDLPYATIAAFVILNTVYESQRGMAPQITSLRTITPGDYMQLDHHAIADLELFNDNANQQTPSLYSVMNYTITPMGARLLRHWLTRPLLNIPEIHSRQAICSGLKDSDRTLQTIAGLLKRIGDLERTTNRLRSNTINPRDLIAMEQGLSQIIQLKTALAELGDSTSELIERLDELPAVTQLIADSIEREPKIMLGDGKSIKTGVDAELDELRTLSEDANSSLLRLEQEEQQASSIKSLKLGYNKVFGYYIEVSKSNLSKVPQYFERRQTTANGERFVTPRLKELEVKILRSKELLREREEAAFKQICEQLKPHADQIMQTARAIAELDVLFSFATCAKRNNWICPTVDEDTAISIKAARHPIVESVLGTAEFVPNDVELNMDDRRVSIITGPNMSGKSTFLKMVALVVVLAQIGSLVPATKARVGLVDRVFTRSGLSDDISGGRSTFMVEMVETAAILNNATHRSLAVLDEIGRGTSTYDGLAIAQSVVEYIHNAPNLGFRTLFATHYHEMTQLTQMLPGVKNLHVEVVEKGDKVYFLRRILEGGADRSYGIYVARLAGMPDTVIRRATQLLGELERRAAANSSADSTIQLGMFIDPPATSEQSSPKPLNSDVLDELAKLDVNSITPIEALELLNKLQRRLDTNS